jgi:hypothetical protein
MAHIGIFGMQIPIPSGNPGIGALLFAIESDKDLYSIFDHVNFFYLLKNRYIFSVNSTIIF